jgi:RRXRR protein
MPNTLRVPVLSITGKPLMPTKASKARRMLKDGKATVVTNDLQVFTIQLTFTTETEVTQPISIGVDPGSHFTGIAAQSKLATHCGFNLDLPREKVTKRMEERAVLRRTRRGRRIKRNTPFKLRNHRQVRFNNRKGLEIVPSIKASKQLELRIISEISNLLPVTHCVIEKITIRL